MNIKLKEVNVMAENRGRPSEKPAVALDNWIQETEDQIWYFDRSKSPYGCWKVENKYKAGEKQAKPKIDQRMYAKNIKEELKDVVEAAKELGSQVGDVAQAAKGKKRQGRKSKK